MKVDHKIKPDLVPEVLTSRSEQPQHPPPAKALAHPSSLATSDVSGLISQTPAPQLAIPLVPMPASIGLRVPKVDSYLQKKDDGFASISMNADALCSKHADEVGASLDEDYQVLHATCISAEADYHFSSAVVLADKTGLSRFSVQQKINRLAGAQLVWQKGQKMKLDQYLTLGLAPHQRIAYIEQVKYDETPLPTPSKLSKASQRDYSGFQL